MKRLLFCAVLAFASIAAARSEELPAWREGYLDIHHISTGQGNAAFLVLPDGTTLLIDAGAADQEFARSVAPLKSFPPKPDGSRSPAAWIADYIHQFAPPGRKPEIDYALITHFHTDHMGTLTEASPPSANGPYRLTGITEVADLLPIRTLVDRAAPDYKVPVDLRVCRDGNDGRSLANYLAYADYRMAHGQTVIGLAAGQLDQIALTHARNRFPSFHIRNVASSGRIWTGRGDEAFDYIPRSDIKDCHFDENPFSNVLKISYGKFDYYTGGDIPGVPNYDQPYWRDIETPVAAAVGPVEVMVLDHHGNRDTVNANMLRDLRPRVIVQENWLSAQPGEEVVNRMASQGIYPRPRDVFATGMAEETRIAIGPIMDRIYKSYHGHVVVRVEPGGDSYRVFILDDDDPRRAVKQVFGPYRSE